MVSGILCFQGIAGSVARPLLDLPIYLAVLPFVV